MHVQEDVVVEDDDSLADLYKSSDVHQSMKQDPELELTADAVVETFAEEEESAIEDPRDVPADLRQQYLSETVAPDEGFLTREAAGGGPDVVPADTPVEAPVAVASTAGHFLRRVGTRQIGEVEVPQASADPVPVVRSTGLGLRTGNSDEDFNTPAYTRKYMD